MIFQSWKNSLARRGVNDMPDETSERISQLSSQLIALQELVTHLQRDLEQMHEAVLRQQKDIDTLSRRTSKSEELLQRAIEGDNFPSPAEDKPPHY